MQIFGVESWEKQPLERGETQGEWNIEKNREKYRVLQKAKLVRSGDIALDTGP